MMIKTARYLLSLIVLFAGQAEAGSFRELYDHVHGAVVIIGTEQRLAMPAPERGFAKSQELGSGVLISEDGKILTASHVVHVADKVEVKFKAGEIIDAKVIASEPIADVALIQLERLPPDAVIAKLGDSDKMQIGDEVFIVGAPYGISHTLATGHISGRHQPEGFGLAEYLQTDAPINVGNSGGPMFNLKGEIVGVVSHILTSTGGFEGLGFAISAQTVKRLLFEERAIWSGMSSVLVTGEIARALNVQQGAGLVVQQVAKASPAERLGLRPSTIQANINGEDFMIGGDIIVEVMGVRVDGPESYPKIRDKTSGLRNGEVIQMKVVRDGRLVRVSAEMTQ